MPPKALVFQSNMFHPQKFLAAMPSKRSTPMFPARSDNFQLLFALLLPARKTDYEYLPLSKTKVDVRNQLCYSRNYAHAVHEKRAIDTASVNTPDGTTVLLSIRLKGSLIYILRIKAEELHSDFANIWKNN